MSEEAILSVSLKDYKQKIDELRASLLSLENTSAEYQSTAEKIKEMQGKLNEVMSVGKQSANAVAGSYNALSQELSALKKEWKNMEIGSNEWEDTAKQIDKLNDKLKDADSKVGVFGRNVGNYSQSFVEAFSMVGGSAGKMGSAIASGAKAANTALKTLAANPIGAAIAAVALVVNGLVQAFKRNEDATNNLKKALVPFQVVLIGVQKVFDVLATSVGKAAVAIGDFFGKLFGNDGKMAQTQKELQSIADSEAQLAKQQRETLMQNANAANEVAELRYKAAQKSKYTEEERLGFLTQAGEKEKEISKRTYEDLKLQYEIIKKKNELTESSAEDKQKEAEAYAAMIQAETDYFNKTKEIESQISELRNKDLEKVKELQKKLKEASQTEIQNLTDKYNKEKKLLEKYHKDTKVLTEQYEKDITKIKAKEWQERIRQEQSYQNIYLTQFLQGSASYYEAEVQGLEEDYRLYKEQGKKIAEQILKTREEFKKNGKIFTQTDEDAIYAIFNFGSKADFYKQINEIETNLSNAQNNLKKASFTEWAEKQNLSLRDLSEGTAEYYKQQFKFYVDYYNKMQKYNDESNTDFANRQKDIQQSAAEALKNMYMVNVTTNQMVGEQKVLLNELYDWFENSPHSVFGDLFYLPEGIEEQLSTRLDNIKALYQAFQYSIEDYGKIQLGIDLSQFELNSEEWHTAYQEILVNLPKEMFDKNLELLTAYKDTEKALLDQRRQNWLDLGNGIGDIMGSMADIYKQDIENQVKNGKMSEEQAKEEFKKVQALKISQAVIQTISGAIAAFMGCQALGQPWGLILGGIQAAAVTAAGVAQIQQIASQNPYDTTGSVSSPAASVTPTLNDYTPNTVTNVTSLSDEQNLQSMLENTNIYVKVSDIDAAQDKNMVRVSESSF